MAPSRAFSQRPRWSLSTTPAIPLPSPARSKLLEDNRKSPRYRKGALFPFSNFLHFLVACTPVYHSAFVLPQAFSCALQNIGGAQDSDKVTPTSYFLLCSLFAADMSCYPCFDSLQDRRRFLALTFRPEDPYCHPAFGEPRPSTSLLLRISRTPNMNATACAGALPAEQLSTDVVAKVSLAYHFEGEIKNHPLFSTFIKRASC